MTISQHKARLAWKARVSRFSSISGLPILLEANEVEDEEANEFIR